MPSIARDWFKLATVAGTVAVLGTLLLPWGVVEFDGAPTRTIHALEYLGALTLVSGGIGVVAVGRVWQRYRVGLHDPTDVNLPIRQRERDRRAATVTAGAGALALATVVHAWWDLTTTVTFTSTRPPGDYPSVHGTVVATVYRSVGFDSFAVQYGAGLYVAALGFLVLVVAALLGRRATTAP
jgi:hypothetical protein